MTKERRTKISERRRDPEPAPEEQARRIREAVTVQDLTGSYVMRENIGSLSNEDGKVVANVSSSLMGTSVYVEDANGKRMLSIDLRDAINVAAQILNET